jgi:hydrogenase maturation protein HypF
MPSAGRKIVVNGTVQGVGFRPWVYRLARQNGLTGSVRNDSSGVTIEAFGDTSAVESFLRNLENSSPPAARIREIRSQAHHGSAPQGFTIIASAEAAGHTVSIPPDISSCSECLEEVHNPSDRRYRYPFTNCTNCGPRFTITLDLPYDRPATTMAPFKMCSACLAEYESATDRRFHAQPNACPECGPQLNLWTPDGRSTAVGHQALLAAVTCLRQGEILALKGLGGYLLMVDAANGESVARLRSRKARYEKPLALMVADLPQAHRLCLISPVEEALLSSPQAPIVLLTRRDDGAIAQEVAPGNPCLGLMLPYTPLHDLLLRGVDMPLVATSGNLSDEPICIGNQEALSRLGTIADNSPTQSARLCPDPHPSAPASGFDPRSRRPSKKQRGTEPGP